MNAILFLAPISAFDQVLSEAPKVNRLVSFARPLNRFTTLTWSVGGLRAPLANHCLEPATSEHLHHPLPQQDRPLRRQAPPLPPRPVLPGLPRR